MIFIISTKKDFNFTDLAWINFKNLFFLNNHRYLKSIYLPFDFLIPRFLDIPGPRFDLFLIILKFVNFLNQFYALNFFLKNHLLTKLQLFVYWYTFNTFKYKFFRIICRLIHIIDLF